MFSLGERLAKETNGERIYEDWCKKLLDSNQAFIHTCGSSLVGISGGDTGLPLGDSRQEEERSDSVSDDVGLPIGASSIEPVGHVGSQVGGSLDVEQDSEEPEAIGVRWLETGGLEGYDRRIEVETESDWDLEDIQDVSLFYLHS